jgi:CheY-like chemotaxis protein
MATEKIINTILVVDDVATLRAGISLLLENFGFAVIQARDGVDALMKYTTYHNLISLVIMDIAMPRLDGIEAIKKIRVVNPFAKVILSSSYIDRLASEAMPNAFLQKPFNGRDLWETIQQVLRGERRGKRRVDWA